MSTERYIVTVDVESLVRDILTQALGSGWTLPSYGVELSRTTRKPELKIELDAAAGANVWDSRRINVGPTDVLVSVRYVVRP